MAESNKADSGKEANKAKTTGQGKTAVKKTPTSSKTPVASKAGKTATAKKPPAATSDSPESASATRGAKAQEKSKSAAKKTSRKITRKKKVVVEDSFVQVEEAADRTTAGSEERSLQLAYRQVEVEGLGDGVFRALGDMVGGVVNGGKRTRSTLESGIDKLTGSGKRAASSTASSGSRAMAQVAEKVPNGAKAVVNGLGSVVKGGSDIIVGTVGCLGGTAVCIIDTVTGVFKGTAPESTDTGEVILVDDKSAEKI
jgi:hypothetical protein